MGTECVGRKEDQSTITLTWKNVEGHLNGLKEMRKLSVYFLKSLHTQHLGFQARGLAEGTIAKIDRMIEASVFHIPD